MHLISRLLGCTILALAALPAWAATITVTTDLDSGAGSLRDAIAKAQPGDTIDLGKRDVELASDLEIPAGKNLTILGAAPKGLRLQATISQKKPAPRPPARLIVKGGGTTIRQVEFTGVEVVIDGAGATVSSCAFDGKGGNCITVMNATGVSIGTPTEVNAFKNCTAGVVSENSTDVTVTNCHFSTFDQAVNSTSDTNLTVSGNSMKGGTGVAVNGSSGTVRDNTITPDTHVGAGVHVGKSPNPGPASKGGFTVKGNQFKVKGNAKAVEVDGRTDVDVQENKANGKTLGAVFLLKADSAALAGGTWNVRDNQCTGGSPGIEVRCLGAVGLACNIAGNTCTRCVGGGIEIEMDPTAMCTLTGNTVTSCGGGADGFGISLSGGEFLCDGNSVQGTRGVGVALHGAGTSADLGTLNVGASKRSGVTIGDDVIAYLLGGSFRDNRGADVFVEEDATLVVSDALKGVTTATPAASPRLDCAPFGPLSIKTTVAYDAAGDLVVTTYPGSIVFVDGIGPNQESFEADIDGHVTIPAQRIPAASRDPNDEDTIFVSAVYVDDGTGPDLGVPAGNRLVGQAQIERPQPNPSTSKYTVDDVSYQMGEVQVLVRAPAGESLLGQKLEVKEGSKVLLTRTVAFGFNPYLDSFMASWTAGSSHKLDVYVNGKKIGTRTIVAK